MQFSNSTGCFYPRDIQYPNPPADLIAVTDAEYTAAMSRPPGATLDVKGGKLVIVPAPDEPLSMVRGRMESAIKSLRDRRQLDGGVKVGANWFLSNDRAVSEYTAIIAATNDLPASTVIRQGWRTMNGVPVDMTPALAKQIIVAGIAARAAIDDVSEAHILAMLASSDPATYDYSSGWPLSFGESQIDAG
jgi:hypothetical protein